MEERNFDSHRIDSKQSFMNIFFLEKMNFNFGNNTYRMMMLKVAHLKENLGALGWEMEETDIERLRSDFPDQIARPEALPLR